jgi:hypothetical protein
MKKTFNLLFFLFLFSFSACAQEENNSKTTTCKHPTGKWQNELSSTMDITNIDTTGKITGTYTSPSGTDGKKYPLIGWIINGKKDPLAISFTVSWGEKIGSITSWTGTCQEDKNGKPQIKTIWNLVRSKANYSWSHILTGSDTFYLSPSQ